jgi:hypothetical protein
MNEKTDLLTPFENLTIKQTTEAIAGLIQDALGAVSVSRISKQKMSGGSYSVPLVKDLLLSWVSRAMAALAQLQFWMETNAFESGLAVWMIGMGYTRGSVLVMELIDAARMTVCYTDALKDLIIDANSPE